MTNDLGLYRCKVCGTIFLVPDDPPAMYGRAGGGNFYVGRCQTGKHLIQPLLDEERHAIVEALVVHQDDLTRRDLP